MQPDVVPAPEGRIGVVVVARQALAQVGFEVGLARLGDARDRQVLDQDVRRQHDRAGQPRRCAGLRTAARSSRRRCGRTARADGAARRCRAPPATPAAPRAPGGAGSPRPRLLRHRAASSGRSRGANRPARGSRAAAHSRCGEVLPHRQRAQALVQEHDQAAGPHRAAPSHWCSMRTRRPPQSMSTNSTCHFARLSSSRSLKRWILPVAVFGRSVTNSIWRGYL